MATVQSFVKCPQCGNAEADHLYNSRTGEEDSFCTRCGYHETWRGKYDDGGDRQGWSHEISEGIGALWYRFAGRGAFAYYSFATELEVADAKRWLREQVASGKVDADTAYVTHWNKETRRLEVLVGRLGNQTGQDGEPTPSQEQQSGHS